MTKESRVTEDAERNAVVDRLMHESETALSHRDVETIFDEEYSRLASGARIKGFVHLLSYRSAMERLRGTTPITG